MNIQIVQMIAMHNGKSGGKAATHPGKSPLQSAIMDRWHPHIGQLIPNTERKKQGKCSHFSTAT
ncbi:MAG: hypothetical protein MJZ64_07380 [Paludibacteraceae bacterium]|nr:hypothetical protein [Paludibacteraceae bacterium]